MIPIDVINKILVYVADLNNTVVITQYHPHTNKECYKINFKNDLLWKIKASILMKRIYPIRDYNFSNELELYKFGIPHYEGLLRRRIFP